VNRASAGSLVVVTVLLLWAWGLLLLLLLWASWALILLSTLVLLLLLLLWAASVVVVLAIRSVRWRTVVFPTWLVVLPGSASAWALTLASGWLLSPLLVAWALSLRAVWQVGDGWRRAGWS